MTDTIVTTLVARKSYPRIRLSAIDNDPIHSRDPSEGGPCRTASVSTTRSGSSPSWAVALGHAARQRLFVEGGIGKETPASQPCRHRTWHVRRPVPPVQAQGWIGSEADPPQVAQTASNSLAVLFYLLECHGGS